MSQFSFDFGGMSNDPSSHATAQAEDQASGQPVDQQVRLDALNPEGSFAVSAPAGSGKTGLLTQRVLTLLAYCDQPEEVLAITFTRKAAGEMQDRIVHALWQAAEQPQPSDPHALRTWRLAQQVLERDRDLQWNLLQNPQRLRIQTIDSLCRSITKQLPLASSIGAQPDTLEDATPAYRLAVRELFKSLEQDSPLQQHLIKLLRHLDNNLAAVENLLVNLLAKREQWLSVLLQARHEGARHYLETVLQLVISEHLELVEDALLLHSSELCSIADRAAANLHQHMQQEGECRNRIGELLGVTGLPPADATAIDLWRAIADLLLTEKGTWRARVTKGEGFPAGKVHSALKERYSELILALKTMSPHAEQLLHEIRTLPSPRYAEHQWQLLDSLTALLPMLAAQLTVVFKQLGATDYTAISQAALMALGDEESPSDLALQLDYRIRHILVDEFQDTASPQLELLRKLTSGWEAGDGRTLFIVGDGMQSCYGFRSANVGLFLDARQQGIGSVALKALDLKVNFRSQAGIVNWVNHVFQHAFPAEDDISRGAVCYSPSVAFKAGSDSDAVLFHACVYTSGKGDSEYSEKVATDGDENSAPNSPAKHQAQWQEAEKVVALVKEAQEKNPDGSIAILVRVRAHLEKILPALSAAGLRFQATEIDRLASRMPIIDLLSLTRALLDPANRIAWLAVLRAPWCGLNNHDLHRIVTAPLGELNPRLTDVGYAVIWPQLLHHKRIDGVSPEGQQILARIVPIIQQTLATRYRKPLRQWIEGAWLALGGPATHLEHQDRENVQRFFSLLDVYHQGGTIRDWQAFHSAIDRLYAAPQSDARLQVMTIHKSKGLEFDTVIIPGLDRSPRKDDKQLLLWQERINHSGQKQLLLGSLAPTGREEDSLYEFMRNEHEKQQAFEATRLLYVGCTRAIKELHLIACVNSKNDADTNDRELMAPAKKSLLHTIWPLLRDQAQIVESAIVSPRTHHMPSAQPEFGSHHILRLSPQWQLPPLHDEHLLMEYRGHEYSAQPHLIPAMPARGFDEIHYEDNPLNLPEFESITTRLARHTGIVIHSALQTLVENRLVNDKHCVTAEHFISEQNIFWRIQLQQLGWSGEFLSQALKKITGVIHNTLSSEVGRWLLNCDHIQSAVELSLMQNDKDDVKEFIIDRTFVANNVRWIVDYKSDEHEVGQTFDTFVAQEIRIHSAQLKRYKQLMAATDDLPIKTALYLVRYGKLIEVNC